MGIPISELKALLQKSGNRCAFPRCGEVLLHEDAEIGDSVVLSKIAHIVGQSLDGPRGRYPLPLEERDNESNLILLCAKHHDIIDNKEQYYTVERLRQMKEDHEALVESATGQAIARVSGRSNPQTYMHETLFSTLFPVVIFPRYIYDAQCEFSDAQKDEVKRRIAPPKEKSEMYPYVIRGGRLYAFQDLGDKDGPFQQIIDIGTVKYSPVSEWVNDPVREQWLMVLLNRSLNKVTGRKGLQWDNEHKRYYFQPDEAGKIKEISYRPLNQSTSTIQVVWQPISKKTGEPRPYWLHRAVSLKFHRVTTTQWCLSIRPEFRVTKDGFIPEDSERIGSRVTRKKSRMFNYDLLGEVNIWRDFLSDSRPRIVFNFGMKQALMVSTTMMQADVEWPGMPEQFAKPFKNVDYPEDLFTWAEMARAQANFDLDIEEEDESDWDEGENPAEMADGDEKNV